MQTTMNPSFVNTLAHTTAHEQPLASGSSDAGKHTALRLTLALQAWWMRRRERRDSGRRMFFYRAEKQHFDSHLACTRRAAGVYHNLFEC